MVHEDRLKAFEAKYAHDEEMAFKATARRNKLFGQWVGGLLGKTGTALDDYAKEVIASDFEEAGDDDVLRKVLGDLQTAGVSMSNEQLVAKLRDCADEAKAQLME